MDSFIKLVNLARRIARFGLARTASLVEYLALQLECPVLNNSQLIILRRNYKFHLCYAGKRAFVIGNGPSLNLQNLSLLKGELTFVVNSFWRHPILSSWQPVGLALADPLYFRQDIKRQHEFAGMHHNITEGAFFVPLSAHNIISSNNLLPEDRTFYCSLCGSMERLEDFDYDLTKPIPGCQTVTLFAIMIALYMGCNPVYLIGMDHDFLATPSDPTHFYNTEAEARMRPEDEKGFVTWSYEELMVAVTKMWRGYQNLKHVSEKRGYEIYNATEGGFLDVFPRVKFEELFS